MKRLEINDFEVEVADAGYATPCHFPISAMGRRIKPKAKNGYVQLIRTANGKRIEPFAHRVRYEAVNGPIPAGMLPDHLCRNRACCNPDHIEPVTPAENIRRGDCAKLNADKVVEMRRLVADGMTQREIARQLGIDPSTVSRAVRGENWADGPCPAWARVKGRACHL